MHNLSKLFFNKLSSDRYIDTITINAEQDAMLRDARRKVRGAIRNAFGNVRQYTKENVSYNELKILNEIKPKFFTQGSYAYKTLNSPCHRTQEIDLDDGVYLPMSIFNGNPVLNKKWFFMIVDNALIDLCNKEGWKFNDKIDTCVRIILPKQAHIDIPLYAISNERHAEMEKQLSEYKEDRKELSISKLMFDSDMKIANSIYLDKGQVYLARRGSQNWQISDPMAIARWFNMEINTKGERLRRICRFLKAWRDFIWKTGGPSSLALMVSACQAYPKDDLDRDDYALLKVTEIIPDLLGGEIINPASLNQKEIIYPKDGVDHIAISNEARQLHKTLENTISGSLDKAHIIIMLRQKFGERMPTNIAWIENIITPAVIVRNTPSISIKPKPIPNTKAG